MGIVNICWAQLLNFTNLRIVGKRRPKIHKVVFNTRNSVYISNFKDDFDMNQSKPLKKTNI